MSETKTTDEDRGTTRPPPTPEREPPVIPDDGPIPRVEPLGSNRPEPQVMIVAGAEDELARIAMTSLRGSAGWYERGGEIVTTLPQPKGGIRVAPVAFGSFYTRLCGRLRWMQWVKVGRGEDAMLVPQDCAVPRPIAESVYHAGSWPSLPYLVAVRDTPILRPDGVLVQVPGYDPETKCVYAPTCAFSQVNAMAGHEEAAAAMQRLKALFCDFTYEDPDMVAVPISAMLSLLGREAIEGAVPCHVFTAPQPGSGKSLQMRVVSQVALGHDLQPFHLPMPSENDRSEGDREEEQEKRLAGAARGGARALMVDNQKNGGTFGGPVIDRYLTAPDEVQVRVLGATGNPIYPWRVVWLLSGNNLHIADDTRRRCIEASIAPTCAKPALRDQSKFRFPLTKGFALTKRGAIAADALTVLVAYANAGWPRSHERPDVSNFEAWQRVVADAMVWAGGPDPSRFVLGANDALTGEDALAAAFMRVLGKLGACPGAAAPDGVKVSDIIEYVWSSTWLDSLKERGSTPPVEAAAAVEAREAFAQAWKLHPSKRPTARVVSARLEDLCGRVLGGADVWPADDASGLQQGEWRVWTNLDRNKSRLFGISAPARR